MRRAMHWGGAGSLDTSPHLRAVDVICHLLCPHVGHRCARGTLGAHSNAVRVAMHVLFKGHSYLQNQIEMQSNRRKFLAVMLSSAASIPVWVTC